MRIKQDFFIWDKFWKDDGVEIGLFRDSDFCPTPSPKVRGSFSVRRMYHKSGMHSRGSAMVLDKDGVLPHEGRADTWRFAPEDPAFRERVLETVAKGGRRVESLGEMPSRTLHGGVV